MKVFNHMHSSLKFQIFHIPPKESLSTINKNKDLRTVESSRFLVVFLAQLKTKVINSQNPICV